MERHNEALTGLMRRCEELEQQAAQSLVRVTGTHIPM